MSTKVRGYSDKELLDKVKNLPSFKHIPSGRWLLGVRSNEDTFNTYDDKIYEFEGEEFIRVVTGTTNAGGGILLGGYKRYNSKGTAILKANEWYYNVWIFGYRRGAPELKQLGNRVKIYRDGNNNEKAEEIGEVIEGYFGINYHTNTFDLRLSNLKILNWLIGNWSAGCQVTNDRKTYLEQMNYYKEAYKTGKQKAVSYVLIDEF
jgi:hypothetical protein